MIVIKIILLFAIVLAIFSNYNVHAIDKSLDNPEQYNPLDNPEQYDPLEARDNDEGLDSMTEKILGIINIVGTILSVVILMIIGIKYMLGSIEEKAEYKKTMMSYVIGAILLFAVPTIANVIYNIAIKI